MKHLTLIAAVVLTGLVGTTAAQAGHCGSGYCHKPHYKRYYHRKPCHARFVKPVVIQQQAIPTPPPAAVAPGAPIPPGTPAPAPASLPGTPAPAPGNPPAPPAPAAAPQQAAAPAPDAPLDIDATAPQVGG